MSERQAVIGAKAQSYARGDRAKKTAILDELVELTGWHRDYARAALRNALKLKVVKAPAAQGPPYGPRIITALIKCWAALRAPAGKRRRIRTIGATILPAVAGQFPRDR